QPCVSSQMNGPWSNTVTATNTTPTTGQVHASGSRCWLFVLMIDRRFAQHSRNGRAGDADPQRDRDWKDPCPDSAGVPGSSFLPGGSVREDPSHRGSDGEGGRLRTSPGQGRSGPPSRIDRDV